MGMALDDFEIHSTKYLEEVKHVHDIFKKKRKLEYDIAQLIKKFEEDTEGKVAIDIIKYERDITMPLNHKSYYTGLRIVVSSDRDDE